LFFPLLMRTVLVSLLPSSAKLRELCFGVLEKASAIQKIKHTYFCTALVFFVHKARWKPFAWTLLHASTENA